MTQVVEEFLDDLRGGRMADAPIVQVEQGKLQGRTVNSPTGKAFYSFQGIPYAKPPLGSLRFKAPQPAEPWEDIRDATTEGNVSAQLDFFNDNQYDGDENCLFLNVYSPNLDGEFLPVMVFIPGGGFKFGSGNSNLYGADFLVERDVVVVTMNYRVGALGFLSLNTPDVPGNAGLKDMVMALNWVKTNIGKFGGNSGNITLFGESAGGAAVSMLTASPLSKSLINRAIIQSGTALNSWAFQHNPIENAKSLAKELGCESGDVEEILEFLSATPARDIVEANGKIHSMEISFKGINLFAPVIEKEFPYIDAVLTESFLDILTSGRVADIPIMIGSCTLEFSRERTTDDLQECIPLDLHIQKNTEESVAIADKIKKLYFKGSHTGVESLKEYFELLSDKLINIDMHRYIRFLVQVSNKPIYFYKFDYVGELNLSGKLLWALGLKHAGHMDDLAYIFKNDLQKDVEPTPQDVKMRERMLRLWTNFAKSGNPTPDENHYLTVNWIPVTKDNLYYIKLGAELSLESNPDKEKMDFWEDLYSKYYKIWEHPKTNNEEAPRKEKVVPVETPKEIKVNEADGANENAQDEPKVENENIIDPVAVKVVDNIEKAVEEVKIESVEEKIAEPEVKEVNGLTNGSHSNGIDKKTQSRTSNEIKMVQNSNDDPKDMIRANDPPEDDLPKNIGVNKFVNFFESLGGKK